MAIERVYPRSLDPKEALRVAVSQTLDALGRSASRTREKVGRIVNPPYPTENGQPLEVRFYEPRKRVILNPQQTRRLLEQIDKTKPKL